MPPSASVLPVSTAGLVGPVNDSCASSESSELRPSSRYVGLNAIVSSSPSKSGRQRLLGLGLVDARRPRAGRRRPRTTAGSARCGRRPAPPVVPRRSAPPSRPSRSRRTSSGSSERYFGNSPSSSRLVVDRCAPDRPMQPFAGAVAGQRRASPRLRRSATSPPRRACGPARAPSPASAGSTGCPPQRPHREPVAVGGGERHLLAVDLDPDAGEDRQRVITAGRDRDRGDGGGERVTAHRAGDLGHVRQRRVLVERQASAA